MRRMRCAWGFEFCRPFPVPGKLGFFYVHTRSVHGAACLTSSSDGRRTRRYPKHETGRDGEDRKSPCPHRGSNSRPSGPEESALSTRPRSLLIIRIAEHIERNNGKSVQLRLCRSGFTHRYEVHIYGFTSNKRYQFVLLSFDSIK